MQNTIAIVGRGRVGPALAAALSAAGRPVLGPLARGAGTDGADVVLLCVPDAQIAAAAMAIEPRKGLVVGHCSGATGLDVLRPHEAPRPAPAHDRDPRGRDARGRGLRRRRHHAAGPEARRGAGDDVGMTPFSVVDDDRAAYHAAASIASNYLVTLEAAAERVAATAGVPREALVPLVRAAVENWAAARPARGADRPDRSRRRRRRRAPAHGRRRPRAGVARPLRRPHRGHARPRAWRRPGTPANGTEVGP